MQRTEIIVTAAGLGLPVIAAPLVVIAQRRLFAFFLAEGTELLGDVTIARKDTLALGALLAKLNAVVLLIAWLALFTCRCFDRPVQLLTAIAVGGILAAIAVTTLIVRANVHRPNARTVLFIGLIVFTGGNLPLIVITAALMAFL